MSTHPNALLVLQLTPDDGSRKTHRAIMAELGRGPDDSIDIGEQMYHQFVAESDYHEYNQISAPEGSIVLWSSVTYGYGETIEWDALAAIKAQLDEWAAGICLRHRCTPKVVVTANYW